VTPSRIIIKPKLRAPLPHPEQLVRSELIEYLGANSGCKLTLVSAPAGYGKTTLLAQWRLSEVTVKGEAGRRFAWVSLDEQDNDPVRLWRHIVEAVRQVAPQEDFGAEVLVGMSAARQNIIEITLPMLINELAELPNRLAVVLDD
jgi:LuxR family maltose regulon positive regulatory protein